MHFINCTQVRYKKRSVLLAFVAMILLASGCAVLITLVFGKPGLSVVVSADNYLPVVLSPTSRVIEVNVKDGERIDANYPMFKVVDTKTNQQTWMLSRSSGVFYAVSPLHDNSHTNGRTIGYVKINQPMNAYQLQLESQRDHNINVGDDIVLTQAKNEVSGTVTLMTAKRNDGPQQKISVAFHDDIHAASLFPGARFSIALKSAHSCENDKCG